MFRNCINKQTNTMEEELNLDEAFETEFDSKPLSKGEKPVKEYIVVAFQLVRIKKWFTMGEWKSERTILDTIIVEHGKTETAKNDAVERAKLKGNCIVVELLERCVITIEDRKLTGTILYKDGRKKLARVGNR